MKLLRTWGEVAGRLGVSVDTARRWHQRYGMPVCKAGGTAAPPQAQVVCDADELDQWARRFYQPLVGGTALYQPSAVR